MAFKIDIDGYIGDESLELFMGSVFSLKKLKEIMKTIPENETELEIYINSGGGLVSEGFAIYDELVSSRFDLRTIAQGICASIATIIHQAGAKSGKREIYQNTDYLIHNPAWRPTGPDPMEASDVEALHEDLKKTEDKIINFYNKITKTAKSVLKEKMAEAVTLTAKEAKELGFVDTIIYTVNNSKKYALVAFVNQNTETMKFDIAKAFKEFENKLTEKVAMAVKKVAVKTNAVATTKDGKQIYYDGPLEVGTKCFEDEAMTVPCADGNYEVDGNTYTIAGGAVTEVKPVVNAENDAEKLKADLAVSQQTINELNKKLELKDQEIKNIQEQGKKDIDDVKNLFNEFKNQFYTGDKLKEEFTQFDGKEQPKGKTVEDAIQKTKELLKERKNKQ